MLRPGTLNVPRLEAVGRPPNDSAATPRQLRGGVSMSAAQSAAFLIHGLQKLGVDISDGWLTETLGTVFCTWGSSGSRMISDVKTSSVGNVSFVTSMGGGACWTAW